MRALGAGAEIDVGDRIATSLALRSSNNEFLVRTPSVDGNRKTWTFSAWIKRGVVDSSLYSVFTGDYANLSGLSGFYITSNSLGYYYESDSGTTKTVWLGTVPGTLRDSTGWYHIMCVADTTQASITNMIKFYINGVLIPRNIDNANASYITQNTNMFINAAISPHRIGSSNYYGNPFDGHMSNIYFIDGQALLPTAFARTSADTGAWVPKNYTGTFTGNSFFLNFSNSSNLGQDASGLGNNWTSSSITSVNQVFDSQYNNYATMGSELICPGSGTGGGCSYANLRFECADPTNGNSNRATMPFPKTDLWYVEAKMLAVSGGYGIGLVKADQTFARTEGYGTPANTYTYREDGTKRSNSSGLAYGASYGVNDVIGVLYNGNTGELSFYKNGVNQGVAYSGLTDEYVLTLGASSSTTCRWEMNFGQRPYAYPVSGAKALCTRNIRRSKILKTNKHFDVRTRSGTGAIASVSDLSFPPDFVWIKSRNVAQSHRQFDSIRGPANALFSNTTLAESVESNSLTAFNSSGITLGSSSGSAVNNSGKNYVDWYWKAGGTPTTNSNGSISSQVSVNASAGFSVVTYTGTGAPATVGHGLDTAPSMIIVKGRNTSVAQNWRVYHKSANSSPASGNLNLSTTDAFVTSATQWNNTAPTSSVFTIATDPAVNEASKNYVAYCFTDVPGYSKAGSYTGVGSTGGPFANLGFRPAFVMIKRVDAANDWYMYDSTRTPGNPGPFLELYPNLTSTEGTGVGRELDFLSNGFKIRNTSAGHNASGGTYIYFAIADVAAQYANAK